MTDDNARYRSSDPFAHTPDMNGQGSDPLAELARLIGQGDQFADLGRDPRGEPAPRAPQYYDDPQPGQHADGYDDRQDFDRQDFDRQEFSQHDYGQQGYEPPRFDAPYAHQQQHDHDPNGYDPHAHVPHAHDRHYPADPAPHYPAEPRYAAEPPRYASEAPRYAQEPAPRYADPAPPAHYAAEQHYAPEPAPHYAAEPAPRFAGMDHRDQRDHHALPAADWRDAAPAPAPARKLPPFDPFAPASAQMQEPDDQRDAPPPRSFKSEFSFPPLAAAAAAAAASAPRSQPQAFDFNSKPALFDQPAPFETPAAAPQREREYAPPMPESPARMMSDHATPPSPPPLDDYYDDAPRGGRRRGLVTVFAVFLLAVVGTATAYGYRTFFGGGSPAAKSAPAVIRASAEPTKVAPPPAADPNANKITYDRFSDRGQNEKVVPREEKPVDIKDAMRTAAAAAPPVTASTAAAAQAAANPPSVLTDPKRVRTVTIRPDAPDASAVTRSVAAVPPARQAAVAPQAANAPLDLSNPQPRAPAAPPPAAVRQAPPPTSVNNALSLAPENNPLPPPGTRPSAAPPQRVASAPAASANGNYLVQVSSQRSEADAQAAFRSVKSKHAGVLGEYQPVIRRADLAGKGTYYRAMVGPFTTRDQAVQLCSSLKASGGDCVVQAN